MNALFSDKFNLFFIKSETYSPIATEEAKPGDIIPPTIKKLGFKELSSMTKSLKSEFGLIPVNCRMFSLNGKLGQIFKAIFLISFNVSESVDVSSTSEASLLGPTK